MDYRYAANSRIADYEIGNLLIDYVNNSITIELKTPKNVLDILQFSAFEEITVTRKEPWGAGKYVAGSDIQYCGNKIIVDIELNSGDRIIITMKSNM